MADRTYPSLAAFARDLPRLAKRVSNQAVASYHEENHKFARAYIEDITPEDTGDLKAGYTDNVEGRKRSPELISTLPVLPDGIASSITNLDEGFHAVDFGRRRNHYPNFSREGGSPQAPRGMSTPTGERLLAPSVQARLRARAARDAIRRIRG